MKIVATILVVFAVSASSASADFTVVTDKHQIKAVGATGLPSGDVMVFGLKAKSRKTDKALRVRPRLYISLFAGDGSRERSFGDNGVASTPIRLGNSLRRVRATTFTPLADGSIVASVNSGFLPTSSEQGLQIGPSGSVQTRILPSRAVIDHQGRIIWCRDGVLRRESWAGVPDPTFGAGGAVELPNASPAIDLAIGPDDSIFAYSHDDGTISKTTSAGSSDVTYGAGGTTQPVFELPKLTQLNGLASDATGRLLLGYDVDPGLGNSVGRISRVDAKGDFDEGFGDFDEGFGEYRGVAISESSQLVIGPTGELAQAVPEKNDELTARLRDADGHSPITVRVKTRFKAQAETVAFDSDGGLVIVGAAGSGAKTRLAVAFATP